MNILIKNNQIFERDNICHIFSYFLSNPVLLSPFYLRNHVDQMLDFLVTQFCILSRYFRTELTDIIMTYSFYISLIQRICFSNMQVITLIEFLTLWLLFVMLLEFNLKLSINMHKISVFKHDFEKLELVMKDIQF